MSIYNGETIINNSVFNDEEDHKNNLDNSQNNNIDNNANDINDNNNVNNHIANNNEGLRPERLVSLGNFLIRTNLEMNILNLLYREALVILNFSLGFHLALIIIFIFALNSINLTISFKAIPMVLFVIGIFFGIFYIFTLKKKKSILE